MFKTAKIQKKYTDYMFDHTGVRLVIDHGITLIVCVLSALVYAFGFRAFIAPSVDGVVSLVSGGLSGFSQNIVLIIKIITHGTMTFDMSYTLQSIIYVVLNIPVFFLGFKGVGKRFAVYSFINVICVSIFIKFLPTITISEIQSDILGRALFAGICTGLSSAMCYKMEISAGGMDIVSYYFAYHRSTSVGKYTLAFNAIVVLLYTILSFAYAPSSGWDVLTITLYTVVYLFTAALVIDALDSRNKKAEVQIITSRQAMPKIILANFPHSCTVVPAKGGFSNEDRLIIYIVVSSFEVKRLVKLVRTVDHDAFISVSNSTQVYGKFFIKPVK